MDISDKDVFSILFVLSGLMFMCFCLLLPTMGSAILKEINSDSDSENNSDDSSDNGSSDNDTSNNHSP